MKGNAILWKDPEHYSEGIFVNNKLYKGVKKYTELDYLNNKINCVLDGYFKDGEPYKCKL